MKIKIYLLLCHNLDFVNMATYSQRANVVESSIIADEPENIVCVRLIFTVIAKRVINLESKIHCATSWSAEHDERWRPLLTIHYIKGSHCVTQITASQKLNKNYREINTSQKSLRHRNTKSQTGKFITENASQKSLHHINIAKGTTDPGY